MRVSRRAVFEDSNDVAAPGGTRVIDTVDSPRPHRLEGFKRPKSELPRNVSRLARRDGSENRHKQEPNVRALPVQLMRIQNLAMGDETLKNMRPMATAKKRTRKADEPTYEQMMSGQDASTARVYGASETFEGGDLVKHSKFGLGIVTAVKSDAKIEVMFEIGRKILVHSR